MPTLLLLGACAKEGMPPGGPEDSEAPSVVAMVPEPGSVNVSTGQPIVFRFSEGMETRSVESALFFTPDIGPTLRVSWRGNELHLFPRVPLRENTTFVVTLSADAADRRRNKLGRSVTLAFSTGPNLDNASLSGTVYASGRPAPAAWVWIYPVDDADQRALADPALAWLDPPASIPLYITQAGDDGSWEMTHLAQGDYRVFAYTEGDSKQGYNPERDLLAVPTTDISLSRRDARFTRITQAVAPRDTTGPTLRSAAASSLDWLQVRFSEPFATDPLPTFRIVPAPSAQTPTTPPPPARVIRTYVPAGSPSALMVQTGDLQSGGRYEVHLVSARDLSGNPGRPARSPVTFTAPARADTTLPRIAAISPADSTRSLDTDHWVQITFTTEIDTASVPAFVFIGPDTITARVHWTDPRTLEIQPTADPQVDAVYTVTFPAGGLTSWTGNIGPAQDRAYHWRGRPPLGRGTLRFEVAGPTLQAPARYRLFLDGAGGGVPPLTLLETSGGTVLTPPLPAGPYLLRGYADLDGNGSLDPGRVRPFRPSEPVGALADTLYVREAFESVATTPLYLGPPIEAGAVLPDSTAARIPPPPPARRPPPEGIPR